MTFSLSVLGHAATEHVEHALVEKLSEFFQDPNLNVSSSTFSGMWHSGPVHVPAAVENVQGSAEQAGPTEQDVNEAAVKLADGESSAGPDTEPPAGEQAPAEQLDETNVAA